VGARISVEKALQALIIESANDIAVMLAEATAGTHEAFVERMNATATRLGMRQTKFVNAHGLPDAEQVTTARDLAKLARAVLRDYPEHAPLWSLLDVHIGKRHFGTDNGLLATYAGADGMKTGFTCDSGFNIVASATRDGHKLIAVVLGENTGRARTLRASRLLDHGFETYDWKTLFPSDSIDTLPMDDDADGPTSIRQSVISWVCGTARRPTAKLNRKGAATAQGGEASRRGEASAKASSLPSWVPW
jgi:D-alanyl-D-alanine carboxypeptidase